MTTNLLEADREWKREWRKFKRERRRLELQLYSMRAPKLGQVVLENDALGVWNRRWPWWLPPWLW